ncbi:dynamin [Penicillium macrosclerotiorum]|uniref:dynamin n=1 Tax=Penicillium macrosclerotiorum TaxID=303699 RepID=UPI0025484375|nr:dynamin [Penicillium macrosclerotiorum]KAJ5666900.1 dynamin [Penicillium macrosclerotiorum]
MTKEVSVAASNEASLALEKTALGTDLIKRRLNQVAQVRARGVGDHISLPQIVVCGDQSTGKSSVLEGITGVPFPRKDGLCTRFATEIILRHEPDSEYSIIASIIPHASQDEAAVARLQNYTRRLSGYEELADVIEEVSKELDMLRIEVTGPTGLHLTIVDLPGLIEGSEDEHAVQLVGNLVNKYLKELRTIILAVLPAGSDVETQPIIRRARSFDRNGERTVGIITKPDLINRGTEDRIAALMQNRGPVKIDLDFFLLKNPSPEQLARGISAEERHTEEEEYFKSAEWKNQGLDPSRIGARSLRSYCENLLERHLERELPKVRDEITKLVQDFRRELAFLGEERSTATSQRLCLAKLSSEFYQIVHNASYGHYYDYGTHFFDANSKKRAHHRLRALVHELNSDFADYMRGSSHKRQIEGDQSEVLSDDDFENHFHKLPPPVEVSLEEFNQWIMTGYKSTRGLELPSSYNHNLLSHLFHEQASRWPKIADTHVRHIHFHVANFLTDTLAHVVKDEYLRFQLQKRIQTSCKTNLQEALHELSKICADEEMQPITYNHYFTDNIQTMRHNTTKQDMKKVLDKFMPLQGSWQGNCTSTDM